MKFVKDLNLGKKLMDLAKLSVLVMFVCIMACSGCNAEEKPSMQKIVLVDLEVIMQKSRPADLARAHLKNVKTRLEDGLKQLDKAWAKEPAANRQVVLRDGLNKLNTQMAVEEEAANAVVMQCMVNAAKSWQGKNKGSIVVPKQNTLAADPSFDISSDILKLMADMKPKFADLPEINIKKPEEIKKDVKKEDDKKPEQPKDTGKKNNDRRKRDNR